MDNDGSLGTGWKTIDGSKYYFDPASGKCMLNVAMPVDGNWFLFGEDGKMQTGFHNVNGATYYFDPSNGVMVAGTTKTISGVSYTFNAPPPFPAFRPTLPVLRAAASRTSSLPRQALQMMKTADRMSL